MTMRTYPEDVPRWLDARGAARHVSLDRGRRGMDATTGTAAGGSHMTHPTTPRMGGDDERPGVTETKGHIQHIEISSPTACKALFGGDGSSASLDATQTAIAKAVTRLVELQTEMRGDTEQAHSQADDVLCDLLRALGCEEVVTAWEGVPKWYA